MKEMNETPQGAGTGDAGTPAQETTRSDNIRIVIQTGGARRWSNQMINPNRTQRFLYESGRFSRVADLPLQPSYESQTLADFLTFCKDEYPADHSILVLWDHLDGVPLEVEIISSTDAATDYRSRVRYNGEMSYLTFSCDNDTEAFSITGVRKIPASDDDANFMYNTKSDAKVEEGSRIVPVYRVTDLMANSDQDVDG